MTHEHPFKDKKVVRVCTKDDPCHPDSYTLDGPLYVTIHPDATPMRTNDQFCRPIYECPHCTLWDVNKELPES